MRPIEMEKIIKKDGRILKASKGSHRHYVHPQKQGKVTIPFHAGDLNYITVKSILKQAGLKLSG